MSLSIVQWPDVKQECRALRAGEAPDLSVVADMLEFVRLNKGYGLAAPQIGDFRRYYVALGKVYVNPKLLKLSGTTVHNVEACYSLPGETYSVKRKLRALVSWEDLSGRKHVEWLQGVEAIVAQHELSHLAGRCIKDEGEPVK